MTHYFVEVQLRWACSWVHWASWSGSWDRLDPSVGPVAQVFDQVFAQVASCPYSWAYFP